MSHGDVNDFADLAWLQIFPFFSSIEMATGLLHAVEEARAILK